VKRKNEKNNESNKIMENGEWHRKNFKKIIADKRTRKRDQNRK
jgi:hypothetical protein